MFETFLFIGSSFRDIGLVHLKWDTFYIWPWPRGRRISLGRRGSPEDHYHDIPRSQLKIFTKELRLIFSNSQHMNRGTYELKQLIRACQSSHANDVTDLIIIHRGVPDALVTCHLPFRPTAAYFIFSSVIHIWHWDNVRPISTSTVPQLQDKTNSESNEYFKIFIPCIQEREWSVSVITMIAYVFDIIHIKGYMGRISRWQKIGPFWSEIV